jgi:hypothetical protein
MYLIVFSEVFSFSIKCHRKLKAVFSFLQLREKMVSIFLFLFRVIAQTPQQFVLVFSLRIITRYLRLQNANSL